ncbi:MAG: c-type cytochrome [Flavobacteriales bacterium]|nr:c-type cytochrome [Flavobacteriales bacterium]MBK7754683.1 c-type cytochrome [Flavobacteriales bacterium]
MLPIFEQNCWVCHPPMGGMDLGEAEAYANLVNVASTGYAPSLRIVPGDPAASVLWQKVTGSGEFGLTMPPNGTTLSFEELQTILDWIEQGAQDN